MTSLHDFFNTLMHAVDPLKIDSRESCEQCTITGKTSKREPDSLSSLWNCRSCTKRIQGESSRLQKSLFRRFMIDVRY